MVNNTETWLLLRVNNNVVQIATLATTICFVYLVLSVVYNLIFHPLANVPGPRLAAATPFWLLWKTFSLQKAPTLHRCLAEYGSIVRIAPDKVLVNEQEDIKTIYSIGTKFVKSDFYPAWGLKGISNIFSTVDPKDHAIRRSITARTFTKSSVLQFWPVIMEHIHALTLFLERNSTTNDGPESVSPTVDFVKLWRHLALDILGTTTLGEDFNLIKTGSDHPFVHDLDSCVITIGTRSYTPDWLWRLLGYLPIKIWQKHLGGEQRLSDYAANTIAKVNACPKKEHEPPTLVSSYQDYHGPDGNPLSSARIIGEIAAVYFAGTDTTSNTLSFITFELARRCDIQNRLHAELSNRIDEPGIFPSYSELETFPYLNAVINEGLRVYAAIPSHLERVVPAGGTKLQGHTIPANTVVGVQAWSIHRDPRLFPKPDSFEPERWLDATPEMKRNLQPWGFGSRTCMGNHLAMMEFRLLLTALVRNFEVTMLEGTGLNTLMEIKVFWLIFPAGGKLPLKIKRRVVM